MEEGFILEPSNPDDHWMDRESGPIPASLEAYVATRVEDAARTVAKLVQRCARTGLWTVITPQLEASFDMVPCRIGASLMLRRSKGFVSAAIVAPNWSVTLLGDEACVDVASTSAIALALIGTPVRARIEIPFLSPTLKVCRTTQIGTYYRFHCH
ncbi:hypothetical protein A9995_10310 [Erythrobacter sp. QSSC1-22B]|nr:hypothetical protein A9995_10310 [Erythrobacter sp. QSSC1-22B]